MKFTRDPRIRAAIEAKRGVADYKLLEPWLKGQVNQAKGDTATLGVLDNFLKQARVNTTIVGLGLNIVTMVKHFGYLANAAKEIGPAWTLRGAAAAVSHVGRNSDFVFARSPEMAARGHDFDQNVREAFSQMGTKYTGGAIHDPLVRSKEYLERAGFWGMGQFLMHVVAIPTWLGAYHKGLSEGMTDADASLYGDKVVRRTQGTGRAMGLSEFQKSPEAYRQLGLFFTYAGTLLNQQREGVRALGRGDWRRAGNTAFWMLAAEPLISSAITGELPEDGESWGVWVLDKLFFNLWSGIPFVRNVAASAQQYAEGRASSLKDAVEQGLISRSRAGH